MITGESWWGFIETSPRFDEQIQEQLIIWINKQKQTHEIYKVYRNFIVAPQYMKIKTKEIRENIAREREKDLNNITD